MHVRSLHRSLSTGSGTQVQASSCSPPTRVNPSRPPLQRTLICEAARIAAYRHDPECDCEASLVDASAGGVGGASSSSSNGNGRHVLHPPPTKLFPRFSAMPDHSAASRNGSNGTSCQGSTSTLLEDQYATDALEAQQQQLQQQRHLREQRQQQQQNGQHAVLAPEAPSHPITHPTHHSLNGSSSNGNGNGRPAVSSVDSSAPGVQGSTAPTTHSAASSTTPAHQSQQAPPEQLRSPASSASVAAPPPPRSSRQRHHRGRHKASHKEQPGAAAEQALHQVLDELEGLVAGPLSRNTTDPAEAHAAPSSTCAAQRTPASRARLSRARSWPPSRASGRSAAALAPSPPQPVLEPQQPQHQGLLHAIGGCRDVPSLHTLMQKHGQHMGASHVVAMAQRLARAQARVDSLTGARADGSHGQRQQQQQQRVRVHGEHSVSAAAARGVSAQPAPSLQPQQQPRMGGTDDAGQGEESVHSSRSGSAASAEQSDEEASEEEGREESESESAGASAHSTRTRQQHSVAAPPLQQATPEVLRMWAQLLDRAQFLAPLASLQQAADMLQAVAMARPMADAVYEAHASQDRARALARKRQATLHQREVDEQAAAAAQAHTQPPTPLRQQLHQHADQQAAGTEGPSSQQHMSRSDSTQAAASLEHAAAAAAVQPKQRHSSALPPPPPQQLSRTYRQRFAEMLLLQTQHQLRGAPPSTLTKLLRATSSLRVALPRSWLAAYYEASGPQLGRHNTQQLLDTCLTLGHLKATPPEPWMLAFYEAMRPCLRSLDVKGVSKLVHGIARMPVRPGQGWMTELLMVCEGQLDELDAPAYALLVHGLGRMGHMPPRGWLDELLESAASLMHDFSPEELSLLLRGLGYLGVRPPPSLASHIFSASEPKLRSATGPQLSDIGWAAVVLLRLQPPRSWVGAWLTVLANASSPAAATQHAQHAQRAQRAQSPQQQQQAGGAASVAAAAASLPAWQPIRLRHALRAVDTLATLRVSQLEAWCARLRAPVPAIQDDESEEGLNAVELAARAAARRSPDASPSRRSSADGGRRSSLTNVGAVQGGPADRAAWAEAVEQRQQQRRQPQGALPVQTQLPLTQQQQQQQQNGMVQNEGVQPRVRPVSMLPRLWGADDEGGEEERKGGLGEGGEGSVGREGVNSVVGTGGVGAGGRVSAEGHR